MLRIIKKYGLAVTSIMLLSLDALLRISRNISWMCLSWKYRGSLSCSSQASMQNVVAKNHACEIPFCFVIRD
ncbi:hypothetical protein BX666DRAFT_1953264 [Dichotomocladium elegans]|nr:hypothetical protein BX666DRAFT_1953264 [Dichotomocladium elegans]